MRRAKSRLGASQQRSDLLREPIKPLFHGVELEQQQAKAEAFVPRDALRYEFGRPHKPRRKTRD